MSDDTSIPLTRPTLPRLQEVIPKLKEILKTGQMTNGKYVRLFEQQFAEKFGIKHAVAMSSCTDGLTWVMRYLPAGEIILPSFTFCATGNAADLAGHKLIFADCDPETFNLDPSCVEDRISVRTRAIVATYIYGNPPDIRALQRIAAKYGVKLILDAAHAAGAKYRGRYAGSSGWAEVFSLTPTKLICCGEGGIVATKDRELAEFVRLAREYGNPGDYNTRFVGTNARMEEFNAILGLWGLKHIDRHVASRNRIAEEYRKSLAEIDGIRFPVTLKGNVCSFKDFTILIDPAKSPFGRDQLKRHLESHGVGCRAYFYPPLHRQQAFVDLGYGDQSNLPNTEFVSQNCLSLPMFSHMTRKQVKQVVRAVFAAASAAKERQET